MPMRRSALFLFLFTLLMAPGAKAGCDEPLNTLTSDCKGECKDGWLCVAYEPEASNNACYMNGANITQDSLSSCTEVTSNGCQYQCVNPGHYNYFTFFVPFGEYKTNVEEKLSSENWWRNPVSELPASTDGYHPHVNNDYLTGIQGLKLSSAVSALYIYGGSDVTTYVMGKASKVSIKDDLFKGSNEVEVLTFSNLDFSKDVPNFAAIAPPSMTKLAVQNCLLSKAPDNMTDIDGLSKLYLPNNYLTSFPESSSSKSITLLSLSSNNLTSFRASFPSLTILYLNDNNLTSIPLSISKMSSLQELYLTDNPITNLDVSQDTFDVLSKLQTFEMDTDIQPPACNYTEKPLNSKIKLCIIPDAVAAKEDGDGSMDGSLAQSQVNDLSAAEQANENTSSSALYIALPTVAAVLVLAIVAFVMRKKRNTEKKATETASNTQLHYQLHRQSSENHSLWTKDEKLNLQLQYEDIHDVRCIGKGAFAEVWLVQYKNLDYYASKRLLQDHMNTSKLHAFVEEIKISSYLDHPKIVRLFGAAWTTEANVQALFEYMDNGDLRNYLRSPEVPRQWTPEKVEMAIDVAEALVYVHSFDPPLIHRDLKSRNVLLSREMEAKLADFGVSKYWTAEATMTQGIGTARWLAPEVVSGQRDYNESSDIFSFGALLTELDTHELPYYDACNEAGAPLSEMAIMSRMSTGHIRPTVLDSCPPDVKNVIMQCLSLDANERPSATEVAYSLRTVRKSMLKKIRG